ncbi:cold shock domain-containing protein [Streptomyces sp. NPDC053560]|uniref:cold shock domain-containing protein n=1 Tax=Streptomyces sp. NPDC053560 TaxID=3365711 RepID=UPI0037D0C279
MEIRRSGTVQAIDEGRQDSLIRADEDGACVVAHYAEMFPEGAAPLQVGERVTYIREEEQGRPVARGVRRQIGGG